MHVKTMYVKKHTLLGALIIVTVSLFCSSCLSLASKGPVMYTSALYKTIKSGDCDVTWNDEAYKMNIVNIPLHSYDKKSINNMFKWASDRGYDFTGFEDQNLSSTSSDKDNYLKGLNTNEIILICNILSEMDGLKPVYVFNDGTPVRKLWNSKSEPVYTDTTANGWFIGVHNSSSFNIYNIKEPSYDYSVDNQNHLTISDYSGRKTIAEISRNSDFRDLIIRHYYNDYDTYRAVATSIQIPICRKAEQRIYSNVSLVKNAQRINLQEGFWHYTTYYHGDMFYIPHLSVFYVKNGASTLSFSDAKSLFAERNIPFNYQLYPEDYLIDSYTQFTDLNLGLNEGNLARFANMLSEYDGLVPCYNTLDGQVLRERLDNADQETYESFSSGWHFYKQGSANRSYYSDVIVTILENNGIDINYTKDLLFYRLQ